MVLDNGIYREETPEELEELKQAEKEYKMNSIIAEINEFKELLSQTDYQALKLFEGELSAEEFAPTKEKRKAWRKRINELEEVLKNESCK